MWWWGQYTHTCVPTATVHGAPYTVNSCVEGAFMCGSYSRVEGTFTCGSYSRVEGTFTCGSYSRVERHSRVEGTFTCGSYSHVERHSRVEGTFMCGSYSRVKRHSHVEGTFMVDGRLFDHFFWKVVGSCAHTCESRTATVHGAPYTVNSCVVVGAIYAYMCTYSYRTR